MNFEEKVLTALSALTDKVDGIDSRLAKVEAVQAKQGERLEKQSERLDEMQNTLTRVAVTQEAQVLPQIQLLFEGHSVLNRKLDSMATKEQVAELADHVEVIKSVVTDHSREIHELQRAQ